MFMSTYMYHPSRCQANPEDWCKGGGPNISASIVVHSKIHKGGRHWGPRGCGAIAKQVRAFANGDYAEHQSE